MACSRKCEKWFARGASACNGCRKLHEDDRDDGDDVEDVDEEYPEDGDDVDDEYPEDDDDDDEDADDADADDDYESLSSEGADIKDAFEDGKKAFEVMVTRTKTWQSSVMVVASSKEEALEIAKRGLAEADPDDVFEDQDVDMYESDELEATHVQNETEDFDEFMQGMVNGTVLLEENGCLSDYSQLTE